MPSGIGLPDWSVFLIGLIVIAGVTLAIRSYAIRARDRSLQFAERLVQERRDEFAQLAGEMGYSFESNGNYRDAVRLSYRRVWIIYTTFVTMWHRIKGHLGANECMVYENMEFSTSDELVSTQTQIKLLTSQTFNRLLLTPVGMAPAITSNIDLDHEFGKHFRAMCDDEDSMHSLLNSGACDYLLENPHWRVEFFDNSIRIDCGRKLSIDEIREGLYFLQRLVSLMPSCKQ
jgi:hypothetical protein